MEPNLSETVSVERGFGNLRQAEIEILIAPPGYESDGQIFRYCLCFSAEEWRDLGLSRLDREHDNPMNPWAAVDRLKHLKRREEGASIIAERFRRVLLNVLGKRDPVRGYYPKEGER